jgi:hypothetical protein
MATSTVHPNHQLISSEDVEGTVSVSPPPPGFGDRGRAGSVTLALKQPRLSWTIALPTFPNAA